jgi:hypothetical protein
MNYSNFPLTTKAAEEKHFQQQVASFIHDDASDYRRNSKTQILHSLNPEAREKMNIISTKKYNLHFCIRNI